MLYHTLLSLLVAQSATAQMFNFFNQQQHHQQQQPKKTYEEEFLNNDCKKYLCPDTQVCVQSPKDCPCPFPDSQLKCPLPSSKNDFVCISKPATKDQRLIQMYDDPINGPKMKIDGLRDCGWVNDAYQGLI